MYAAGGSAYAPRRSQTPPRTAMPPTGVFSPGYGVAPAPGYGSLYGTQQMQMRQWGAGLSGVYPPAIAAPASYSAGGAYPAGAAASYCMPHYNLIEFPL